MADSADIRGRAGTRAGAERFDGEAKQVSLLAYSPAERIDPSPWLGIGRRLEGPEAWDRLVRHRQNNTGTPFCVYIHIPFCRETCGFCALYRFPITDRDERLIDSYVDALLDEIDVYGRISPPAAPATVHFGGGTPLSIGIERLERIINAVSAKIGSDAETEWALETTGRSIDDETVSFFTGSKLIRIHVGVQTLDDGVRASIGRREAGGEILKRLGLLLDSGLKVSVDLILGLPGLDKNTVEEDVDKLWSAGIRTYSVCELFVKQDDAGRARASDPEQRHMNYKMWLQLYDKLTARGLMPIHYGQFARKSTDNLYYTYPVRGEDCLALGAYSHGAFANCFYGNKLLDEYLGCAGGRSCTIGFGWDYGEELVLIRSLETAMLANRIPGETVNAVRKRYRSSFERLWRFWEGKGLVRKAVSGTGDYLITGAGNWFLGNMIRDLRELA